MKLTALISCLVFTSLPSFLQAQDLHEDPSGRNYRAVASWKKHGTREFQGLGNRIEAIGDINQDGITELLVEEGAGVSVLSGKDASTIYSYSIDDFEGNSSFGDALAGLGDLDGDGVPDFAISQPNPPFLPGEIYLFSGATGILFKTIHDPKSDDDAYFGSSMDSLGDVNRDGIPDFAIGAPRWDDLSDNLVGVVHVFCGATHQQLFEVKGTRAVSYFGNSVAGLGDVNGDGTPDFVVGAPESDGFFCSGPGYASVFSGSDGELLHWFTGFEFGITCKMGLHVSNVGDADLDGHHDVLVAGINESGEGPGKIFLFSGKTGSLLRSHEVPGWPTTVQGSLNGAGDVDGDGYPDYMVGVPNLEICPLEWDGRGRLQLYSGRDGSLLANIDGEFEDSHFGNAATSVGDWNHDGLDDLVITAKRDRENFYRGGSISLFESRILSEGALNHQAPKGALHVDCQGGADFLEISEAISAATDGDQIFVAPGTYSHFEINNKALTIRPTSRLFHIGAGNDAVEIRNYSGTDQPLTIIGMQILDNDLSLRDCTNQVILKNCGVFRTRDNGDIDPPSYVSIDSCDQVLLSQFKVDSKLYDSNSSDLDTVHILDSTVRIDDLWIWGIKGASHKMDGASGARGIHLENSDVTLAGPVFVRGGLGGDGLYDLQLAVEAHGGDGIFVDSNSSLFLMGQEKDEILGGDGGIAWDHHLGHGGDGLVVDGTATVSRVTLIGGKKGDYIPIFDQEDGSPWSGTGSVEFLDTIPVLKIRNENLTTNGKAVLDVDSVESGNVLVIASDESGFEEKAGFVGPDLSVLEGNYYSVFQFIGATDEDGQLHFELIMPSDPALVGLAAHFQCIVKGDSGTQYLTNAVSRVFLD